MVIALSGWIDEESESELGSQGLGLDSRLMNVQNLQKSLSALIILIEEGTTLSSSSDIKDKKSSTRRRSPPLLPTNQVLLLDGEEDEQDPFGADCTHLVCAGLPPSSSSPYHWLVFFSSLYGLSVCFAVHVYVSICILLLVTVCLFDHIFICHLL